jgi:hypothetical protein
LGSLAPAQFSVIFDESVAALSGDAAVGELRANGRKEVTLALKLFPFVAVAVFTCSQQVALPHDSKHLLDDSAIKRIIQPNTGTAPVSTQSVAGCWDFEQSNDQWIADSSGSGNLMSAANCMDLPFSLAGDNRAVKLGGSNEYLGVIIKPGADLAQLDDRFTVALRIKPDELKSRCVILAYQYEGLGWTVGLTDRGELIAGLRGGGVSKGLSAPLPESGGHVAIVFSRQQGPVGLYIDGESVATTAEKDFWGLGDTTGFLVGCRRNRGKTPSQQYRGLLDDLIVINSVINDGDALKLAQQPYRKLFNFSDVEIPDKPFFWNTIYTGEQLGHLLKTTFRFNGIDIQLEHPPAMLEVNRTAGLLVNKGMQVQKIHAWPRPRQKIDVPRGFIAPSGDWLVMFTAGRNQYGCAPELRHVKTNEMLTYRSTDRGRTWTGPTRAWNCNYSSSFVVPFIPRDSSRIYLFTTEPIPSLRENKEDGPIVYRTSDDNGHTWSAPVRIRPTNLPDFTGISGMRMCQTRASTWLLGTHKKASFHFTADNGFTLREKQFVLRSTDDGKTWKMHLTAPAAPPQDPPWRNEGRVINLSDGGAMMLARVQGHLWESFSNDDGLTWSLPAPQELVHPAAPPMLFHLSDGETLVQLIHNRYGGKEAQQLDRNELWVSLSTDDGKTWSEPAFLMANLVDNVRRPNLSYTDLFVDGGQIHFIVPHLWEQVLRVSMSEQALLNLPTAMDLQ